MELLKLSATLDEPTRAFQVLDRERIRKIDAELMLAFLKKNPGALGTVLAPIPAKQRIPECQFLAWESLE